MPCPSSKKEGRRETTNSFFSGISVSIKFKNLSRLRPSIPWIRLAPLPSYTAVVADCGVTTDKIANSAVDSTKLADSAVTTDGIADYAVTSNKIADSSVTANELADSAVSTIKMLDNSVTDQKINDGAVTASKFYDTSIPVRVMEIHATDTALAVGDTLASFFIPAELNGYDLISAYGAIKVVSTTGRPTIQIRNVTDGADMLVNKITLDSGEKTSYTSDTAFSIDTANDCVATGNEIAIDVDSAGTGTEDLYVILSFRKP